MQIVSCVKKVTECFVACRLICNIFETTRILLKLTGNGRKLINSDTISLFQINLSHLKVIVIFQFFSSLCSHKATSSQKCPKLIDLTFQSLFFDTEYSMNCFCNHCAHTTAMYACVIDYLHLTPNSNVSVYVRIRSYIYLGNVDFHRFITCIFFKNVVKKILLLYW